MGLTDYTNEKEFIALIVTCKYGIATEDIFKRTLDLTCKIYSSLFSSKYLSKYQTLNATGHFLSVVWSTQEKLLKCRKWTAGKGSLSRPFLYLKRLHDLLHSHDFACRCADVRLSDERVSDKKHPSFPPSIQQRFTEHLPRAMEVQALLYFLSYSYDLPKNDGGGSMMATGPPCNWCCPEEFHFLKHKLLNLSIAISPASSPFVFYDSSTGSHLPQGYWNSLAEPQTSQERRNYRNGWGGVNSQSYSYGTTPTGPAGSATALQAWLVSRASPGEG